MLSRQFTGYRSFQVGYTEQRFTQGRKEQKILQRLNLTETCCATIYDPHLFIPVSNAIVINRLTHEALCEEKTNTFVKIRHINIYLSCFSTTF